MLLKAVEVFFQLLENDVVLCRTGGRVAAQQALSRAAEACGALVKAALKLVETVLNILAQVGGTHGCGGAACGGFLADIAGALAKLTLRLVKPLLEVLTQVGGTHG